MYISITQVSLTIDPEETKANVARVHEFLRTMPGFRWAMLLRSLESSNAYAAVSMWLAPEQASSENGVNSRADATTRGFDVATARGSMTPASHVAIVDWQVGDEVAARFTNRWNAVYHAIEDRIGSRLLRDLHVPGSFAGLHAVQDEANLNPEVLGGPIGDADGLSVSPLTVRRYEVVLLTEA